MMGWFDRRDGTAKDNVRVGPMTRTEIDLGVIREHLDIIEEALMHGYRLTLWHFGGDEALMVRGMDAFGGQRSLWRTQPVHTNPRGEIGDPAL